MLGRLMRRLQLSAVVVILVGGMAIALPAWADTYTGPPGHTPRVVSAAQFGAPSGAVVPDGSSAGHRVTIASNDGVRPVALPITGADIVQMAAIGLTALALGLLMVVRARRRRIRAS